MHSVLAILRKDLRRLRPQILVFWVLLLLSVAIEPWTSYWRDSGPGAGLAAMLAACYLVAAVIHQEPLTGDTEYWLTRPISRSKLLGEKAIFIALSVLLPGAIAQIVSLLMLGISPYAFAGALLLRQCYFLAAIIVPIAALAVVTRTLVQFMLGVFSAVALFLLLHLAFGDFIFRGWNLPQAAWYFALAAGTGVVIAIQYSQRATALGRIIICAITIVCYFAARAEADDSVHATVRMTYERPVGDPPRYPSLADHYSIPIRIEGLPQNAEAVAGPAYLNAGLGELRHFRGGRGSLILPLDASPHVRGSVEMTLFVRVLATSIPSERQTLHVPGIGVCTRYWELVCLTPAPHAGVALSTDTGLVWIVPPGTEGITPNFLSPFQPVERYTGKIKEGSAGLVVVRTLTSLRAEFDFPNLPLAGYRVAE